MLWGTAHEGGPGRPVEVDSKFSLPKGRALDCVRLGVPARKDRSPAPAAFELTCGKRRCQNTRRVQCFVPELSLGCSGSIRRILPSPRTRSKCSMSTAVSVTFQFPADAGLSPLTPEPFTMEQLRAVDVQESSLIAGKLRHDERYGSTSEMAESGDATPADVTTMVVHNSWPFNMLRARRTPKQDGEEIALVPMAGTPHPPPAERYQWRVLERESTQDFWKLAPGSKSNFQAPDGNGGHSRSLLLKDYDEAKEGWVVRVYQGHETLERSHEQTDATCVKCTISAEIGDGQYMTPSLCEFLCSYVRTGDAVCPHDAELHDCMMGTCRYLAIACCVILPRSTLTCARRCGCPQLWITSGSMFKLRTSSLRTTMLVAWARESAALRASTR